ncbi:MAG TPA: hypothetical protein ENK18_01820 [Deltaproteobacteria bacterium]|nr:hypothetical protein [Deltaproteobacteria bacterium]
MYRGTLAVLLGWSLACAADLSPEDPPDQPPVQDTAGEERPPLEPLKPPPPGRRRSPGGRRGGGFQGIFCLSTSEGGESADVRLVFDGEQIVGGSASWILGGKSHLAEPLEGSRQRRSVTASGPRIRRGGPSGSVELSIQRSDGSFQLTIDGHTFAGRVQGRPCEGD